MEISEGEREVSEYQKYSKLPYFKTPTNIFKTQEEIRRFLKKYDLRAISFSEISEYKVIILQFALNTEKQLLKFRFKIDMPMEERYRKQVYRGLYHYLKARFTSVIFGINTVEQEFMAEIIMKLPNGTEGTMRELYGDKVLDLKSDLILPFKDEAK